MIILDPGHGGTETVGSSTPFGRRTPIGWEKDLNLALARAVAERALMPVRLTRTTDVNPSLAARLHGVEHAHAFVSVHGAAADTTGAWVHAAASPASQRLARRFAPRVRRAELAVLHPAWLRDCPGALLELPYGQVPFDALVGRVVRVLGANMRVVEQEVTPVMQRTELSCWAAAAAMLLGWRDGIPVHPMDVVARSGRWFEYWIGLSKTDIDELAADLKLVAIPANSKEEPNGPKEWADLLDEEGPLMVVLSPSVPDLHAVVIYKIETDGTDEGTTFHFHDPKGADGLASPRSYEQFMMDLDGAYMEDAEVLVLHPGGRPAL